LTEYTYRIMHKLCYLLISLVLFALPNYANAKSILEKADQKCVKQNLNKKERENCLHMYKKAVQRHPESYEANWKMARACRAYAVYAKRNKQEDWQNICKNYGKKCIHYAKKAIEKEPEKVQGHFYYGLCIDSYSKGISILTAINQGLKDKAQKHFSKAYSLNKNYLYGAPVLALACMWDRLPWPLRDKQKALKYYQEAEKIVPKGNRVRTKLQLNMGNFLLQTGKNKKKAIRMLKRATHSNSTYFAESAREILDKYQ